MAKTISMKTARANYTAAVNAWDAAKKSGDAAAIKTAGDAAAAAKAEVEAAEKRAAEKAARDAAKAAKAAEKAAQEHAAEIAQIEAQAPVNMTPAPEVTVTTPPAETILAPDARPAWARDFEVTHTPAGLKVYRMPFDTDAGHETVAMDADAMQTRAPESYKFKTLKIPDSFNPDEKISIRARELAFRAIVNAAAKSALDALERPSTPAEKRDFYREKLLVWAYRICILDRDLYTAHTELDGNAERIAEIMATYYTDAFRLDKLPYEKIYSVFSDEDSTAAAKEAAVRALHEYAAAKFSKDEPGIVPCVQSKAYTRDVRRFTELLVKGFSRTRAGLVDWKYISMTACRKQCALYLVSLVQEELIDVRRMRRAEEAARAAEKAAQEAVQPAAPEVTEAPEAAQEPAA